MRSVELLGLIGGKEGRKGAREGEERERVRGKGEGGI